jgi:hypothetical protein
MVLTVDSRRRIPECRCSPPVEQRAVEVGVGEDRDRTGWWCRRRFRLGWWWGMEVVSVDWGKTNPKPMLTQCNPKDGPTGPPPQHRSDAERRSTRQPELRTVDRSRWIGIATGNDVRWI